MLEADVMEVRVCTTSGRGINNTVCFCNARRTHKAEQTGYFIKFFGQLKPIEGQRTRKEADRELEKRRTENKEEEIRGEYLSA